LRRNSGKSSQSGLAHLWQPNDIALTPFLGEHITIGGMDFVEPTKASLMHTLSHRGGSRISASSKADIAASTCGVRETTCSITAPMCNLYSITTNQAAIIALFRVMNRYVGNLPPMPGRVLDARTMGRGEGRCPLVPVNQLLT
jgi:hypothetical protein